MNTRTTGNAFRINNQEKAEKLITLVIHDWEYIHWVAAGEKVFGAELPFAYLGTSPWPGSRTNDETLSFSHPFNLKITELLLEQGSYGVIVYALSEETLRQADIMSFFDKLKGHCPGAEHLLLKNETKDQSRIKEETAEKAGLQLVKWKEEGEAKDFFEEIKGKVNGMEETGFHLPENREWAEWTNYSISEPLEDGERRILLVGDSISAGYGSKVQNRMRDYHVDRLNTSEGLSHPNLLKMLDMILGEYHYQLIHINIGIHMHGISTAEYSRKLEELFQWMKDRYPDMKIVFAATTPASEKITKEGCFNSKYFQLGDRAPVTLERENTSDYVYSPESSAAYMQLNEEARKVCARMHLPFNDLFSFCVQRDLPKADAVHFQEEGYEQIAMAVAECIMKSVETKA